MKCWWHEYDRHNWGDWLGPYIIKKLTGKLPEHSNSGKHLMLAGSILQDANADTIVLGAGFGARDQKLTANADLRIVRGPITASILKVQGYKPPKLYGDPGLIMPYFYNPRVQKRYSVGYLPHYTDYNYVKKMGVKPVFNICAKIEQVVDWVCQCDGLITSSLHGVVVAHAYGIPVKLVKWGDKIAGDGLKWLDYGATVGWPELAPNQQEYTIPRQKPNLHALYKTIKDAILDFPAK